MNKENFDLWSSDYDNDVSFIEQGNKYPFAGYNTLLKYIFDEVSKNESASILDIGFGTGKLTYKLYKKNYKIYGIDFSDKMTEIAKDKMPNATLVCRNFIEEFPDILTAPKYDYIISTYAIHHLTDEDKFKFIKMLIPLLKENGKILFGDVSFETRQQLEKCKHDFEGMWDEEEIYFVFSEMKDALGHLCNLEYKKISFCSGVMTIQKNNLNKDIK